MVEFNLLVVTFQDESMREVVLQLANVHGPVMVKQRSRDPDGEGQGARMTLSAKKRTDEVTQIFSSLAERAQIVNEA